MDLIEVQRELSKLFKQLENQETNVYKLEADAEIAFKSLDSLEKENLALLST